MTVFIAHSDRTACQFAAADTAPRALIAIRPAASGLGTVYRSVKLSKRLSDKLNAAEIESGGVDDGSSLICRPGERLVARY
jgi:hypothetical protein